MHQAWSDTPDRIARDSAMLADLTRKELEDNKAEEGEDVRRIWIDRCVQALEQNFDSDFGGFGYSESNPQMPKFPEPSNLMFLIHVIQNDADNAIAKQMFDEDTRSHGDGWNLRSRWRRLSPL